MPYTSCIWLRVLTRCRYLDFERIWRIVRKLHFVKSFVFKNQQWFESHPLRHASPLHNQLALAFHDGRALWRVGPASGAA